MSDESYAEKILVGNDGNAVDYVLRLDIFQIEYSENTTYRDIIQ